MWPSTPSVDTLTRPRVAVALVSAIAAEVGEVLVALILVERVRDARIAGISSLIGASEAGR